MTAPRRYVTGFCGTAAHDSCPGSVRSNSERITVCTCTCHTSKVVVGCGEREAPQPAMLSAAGG